MSLRSRAFSSGIAALFGILIFTSSAFTHELRPAYLELREENAGEFSALWKTPMRGDRRLALSPEFSFPHEIVTPLITRQTDDAAVQTWKFRASSPVRGGQIRIAGLEGTMTDALIRIEFTDGTTWTERLTPQQPYAVIPKELSVFGVASVYTKLGIEHILFGIDHLLFVLGLIMIARGGWLLVKTVSAFTVSHCLTLTAATLGWVYVPQQPVEAVIALSIVFVAVEAVHCYQGRQSLTSRAPWLVALTFGFLHGLGFAGVLSETGLPAGHIPAALLFFSAGVEAGHLLFVGLVVSAITFVKRIELFLPRWADMIPPYAIGSFAMFWMMERISLF